KIDRVRAKGRAISIRTENFEIKNGDGFCSRERHYSERKQSCATRIRDHVCGVRSSENRSRCCGGERSEERGIIAQARGNADNVCVALDICHESDLQAGVAWLGR